MQGGKDTRFDNESVRDGDIGMTNLFKLPGALRSGVELEGYSLVAVLVSPDVYLFIGKLRFNGIELIFLITLKLCRRQYQQDPIDPLFNCVRRARRGNLTHRKQVYR